MSTFNTKKVWHSGLKYKKPLMVMFGTGQLVDSKYEEGQQIIYFTVRGDETEYYYQIENSQIAKDLESITSKVWYKAEADGQNDEATLALTPVDENDLPAITATVGGPTSTPAKRQATATAAGEHCTGSQEANMQACMDAAFRVFGSTFDNDVSEADRGVIERLAVSMFIQSNNGNFRLPITAGGTVAEVAETTEPITDGPDLNDLKELAAGLPLRAGTSHDDKQLKRILDKIAGATEMSVEDFDTAMAWVLAEGEHQEPSDNGEDELPF